MRPACSASNISSISHSWTICHLTATTTASHLQHPSLSACHPDVVKRESADNPEYILRIFTARCHASALCAVVLCLSACTSQCSTEMAKRRITQTTPHKSPVTLVSVVEHLGKQKRGHPPSGGAKFRWDRLKLATFARNSL